MKTNKNVKQWLAIVMVGLFTFLSVIQAIPLGIENGGIDVEASGKYNDSELTSVLPSAYFETKNAVTGDGDKFGDSSKQFRKNIQEVSGRHFGNIGLFVGFPGDSQSQLAALNTSNAISINEANNHFNNNDVKKYYAFGAAVQDLSQKGIKSDKVEESSERTINGLSAAAKSMTKAGARLIRDYNPGPLIQSLYRTENGPKGVDLRNYEDNKLVQIVMNNPPLKSALEMIRTSPTGSDSAKATLFTWIVFLMVIMLIVAGVLMKVMNGRAAGESYRKAVVKIVVSALALPFMAMFINFGVGTFVEVTDPDITPQEEYAEQAIGEHLNFADWYATGFAVPDGIVLSIKDDKFRLSQGQIRAINEYSYGMLVGGEASSEKIYERLISAGDQNRAQPSFVEKDGWDGMAVKQVGDTIVKNVDGEDTDAEGSRGILSKIFGGSVGSYMYGFRNEMSNSDGGYKISVGSPEKDAQQSNKYGMSPLASYNMMRSTFSGGNITSSLAKPQMASVVYSAFVGADGEQMNGITRLIATYAMVVAAMKGLATIFAAGLGGIFSGAAGSGLGSSSAAGQGIGGVIALIGGVVGMGIIMNISFIFLEELYSIFFDIFQGTAVGDPNMLEPFRDMADNLPGVLKWFKSPLKKALNSLSTAVITLASIIALPKFGKIPINLFAQKMSEIPANFAEKAQMMENRFTGDYRAGGGGRGSSIANFNSQMSEVGGGTMAQMAGVGAAGAALGGMAMSKTGDGLVALGDKIMGDKEDGDLSMNIDPEGPEGPPPGGGPGELPDDDGPPPGGGGAIQAGDENYEGTELSTEDHVDGDNLEGDNLDSGVTATDTIEGGSKEASSELNSSKDTQSAKGISGPQKDGDSNISNTSKEDSISRNIEGNISNAEGDQSVAGDRSSNENIDRSGDYSNISDMDGNQSVAGDYSNIDQSGGMNQDFAGNVGGDIAGGQSINTGGRTDISSNVGGRNEQHAGDQAQSITQANRQNMAVDARSDVNSSMSTDQNSSVQQSQNVSQNSDSYINSQRSSINTGTGNAGAGGQGKSINKPESRGGAGNVGTPRPSSQGNSQGNSSLKTGTPTMSKGAERANIQTNQGPSGRALENVSQSGQNTQARPVTGGPTNNVSQVRTPQAAAGGAPPNSPVQARAAGGGPPHNPPNVTDNLPNNPPKEVVTPPVKNSGFRMKVGKVTQSLGRGMQSGGGEVSGARAMSAIKHGAASAFVGGNTQKKTQAQLNKVQGKPNVPIDEPNEPKKPNSNRGNRGRPNDRENEILMREEREEANRR